MTVTNQISGSGALIQSGLGTLTLSAANTYTGTTTVSNGTLLVNGSLASGSAVTVKTNGTFVPGANAIGKLTINNSVTLSSGSLTVMELSRNGGVLTNDLAVIGGTLASAGLLVVTNIGTNALQAGDKFTLFQAGAYSGGFTNVVLPNISSPLVWNIGNLAVDGTIIAVVPASPVINSGVNISAGKFNLQFTGTIGWHYRVEFVPSLPASGPWQVVADIVSLATSPCAITFPVTNGAGFYRVGLVR